MKIENVPFIMTDWDYVNSQEIKSESGFSIVKTFEQGNIRIRFIEYSQNYKTDHWCKKGHVGLVLDGQFVIAIDDGRLFRLKKGMSFQVADDIDAHKAYTKKGAKVFIVD